MTEVLPLPSLPQAEVCSDQIGAICWRMHRGKIEVLLITSRDTGRWVIPKGWPINGLTLAAAAAREAWEEAGVEGHVLDASLGHFNYAKIMTPVASIPCNVVVFGLRVSKLKDRFPERKQRQRKWFGLEKAARMVDEPGLRELLRDLPANPAFHDPAALALA